ncbi:TIGR03086 family metal-binding protein [Nonomuraea soli]|uniref:Uncharacterized protein (TIGR03086 family) n=1 Tax=Nonomuraea soli TaxID=1032476 RepID=A0A7W0CKR1_9ACTN|nr:TIGR03086 family metal-binding protein [Nonomuraea soli]MBA2892891.1 uncharacterized protein (TIGR03086 family) [Nonomuraea soli]
MTGGLALLERAISYTLGSLVLVTPQALDRPTPCSAWDLRALLAHMDDSLAALFEAADLGEVEYDPAPVGRHRASQAVGDPVASLRLRACRLIGAWTWAGEEGVVTVGGCPLTAMTVAGVGAIEVAVHGWDVAMACGQNRPIPGPLATELMELAPVLIDDDDRPVRFAARVPVGPAATPGERLLAYLGRAAR